MVIRTVVTLFGFLAILLPKEWQSYFLMQDISFELNPHRIAFRVQSLASKSAARAQPFRPQFPSARLPGAFSPKRGQRHRKLRFLHALTRPHAARDHLDITIPRAAIWPR